MLQSLAIRDFVIVQALELEFSSGFTALTGETGAGKSLLIDALGFVLGERADSSWIRDGCERAEVSAGFAVGAGVRAWLDEAGFDLPEADEPLLLRRSLDRNGRTRAFVHGAAATLALLRDLSQQLLDIHGQHEHQSLLRSAAQGELLDRHAGLAEPVRDLGQRHRAWRDALQALEAARTGETTRAQKLEQLGAILEDLDALRPLAGEWERMEADHRRLSHASALIEGAQAALNDIAQNDDALSSVLGGVLSRIDSLVRIDPGLDGVREGLAAAQIQLDESARQLRHYLDRSDLDGSALDQLDQRLSAWHAAARRWRCPPTDLAGLWERTLAERQQLDQAGDLAGLEQQAQSAESHYREAAMAISQSRTVAAAAMAEAVTQRLQDLSMAGARLDIRLVSTEPTAQGLERAEFLISSHGNGAARPIAKVASGGELSRIGLAIAVVAAAGNLVPTLVFDDVDAGVGGQVATTVGRLLRELGATRQVFCVTHLAQVAAHAEHHFSVQKAPQADGAPGSSTRLLGKDERVAEIARMLGGDEHTAASRDHAVHMLKTARQGQGRPQR